MRRFNLDREFGINYSDNGEYVRIEDVVQRFAANQKRETELLERIEASQKSMLTVQIERDNAIKSALAASAEIERLKAQQVAGEPCVYEYRINNTHTMYSTYLPPEDAYDEGTLKPLYASPQPSQEKPE